MLLLGMIYAKSMLTRTPSLRARKRRYQNFVRNHEMYTLRISEAE